jgi:GT2 family glycosyltransferase
MALHILTLTWNGLSKLEKLSSGLIENLHYANEKYRTLDCLWHVRDNGSTDGTVKEIETWLEDGGQMRVYDIGHNRDNFAKGINYLFEKANVNDDDFILLLNNDVQFVSSDSLYQMFQLQKKTDAAIVGARLLYEGTNKLQHAGVIFGERYGRMPYHFRHGETSDKNSCLDREFQAVTAAVCLIKADYFKKVGGADEQFFWAFEDIDLALRIREAGGRVVYSGSTNIFHEESATLKKNPVNKMFLQSNVQRFKQKWFGKYELDHQKYLDNPTYNEIK